MNSEIDVWVIIGCMTLITIVTRSLFLMTGTTVNISPTIQRSLRFAPAATLIALILPSMVTFNHELTQASINPLTNPKLAASIVAGVIFFYTRHMMLMITVGMGLYAALRFFAA
jgi:branched-subunit amino acid transport protein